MQNKLFIKNKKLKNKILIKKNYISKFIRKIAKNHEKIFDEEDEKELKGAPLPPDYDGWLQYTELNTTDLNVQNTFDAY